MTEKRYICNTTSRREYYLPGGEFVCRIDYNYPYVHCTVRSIFRGDVEQYDASKLHPHWQKHVTLFETLAWEKYRNLELVKVALERHRNSHKQGS